MRRSAPACDGKMPALHFVVGGTCIMRVSSVVPQLSKPRRVFLLSPANAAGLRAQMVISDRANFDLAKRLRAEGASLGEVFSFISGLYFRGKLAYAQAFAEVPPGMSGVLVITAGGGLVPAQTPVSIDMLRQISAVDVNAANPHYRAPLERDAKALARQAEAGCQIVLLGSIATPKYVDPLLGIFGERLLFPAEFVGRGDMSRGGLMLRCVRSGQQLTYVPVINAVRHGPRPPKLARIPRQPSS